MSGQSSSARFFAGSRPSYWVARRPVRHSMARHTCIFAWSIAYSACFAIVIFLLTMATWSREPVRQHSVRSPVNPAGSAVAGSAEESSFMFESVFSEDGRAVHSDDGESGKVPEFYGSGDLQYPLLVDMPALVARLRRGLPPPPGVRPINLVRSRWLLGRPGACSGAEFLVLLVKSHPDNRPNRDAIRATWGDARCWQRPARLFFLLGVRSNSSSAKTSVDSALMAESAAHGDLLVRDYFDHYYSNTVKLMSGVQWASVTCPGARFVAFLDDDFALSPRSAERYLAAAADSPAYERFIGGWVWRSAQPRRPNKRSRTKWDVAKSDYPWGTYPPYVSAGAMFISGPVLRDIADAMKFTRYLRFDDIFVGLVLHKLALTPIHMNQVRADMDALNGAGPAKLRRIIASHGFRSPDQLRQLWPGLMRATGLSCTAVTPRAATTAGMRRPRGHTRESSPVREEVLHFATSSNVSDSNGI